MKNNRVDYSVVLLSLLCSTFLFGCSEGGSQVSESQSMLRRTLHHDGAEREFFIHKPTRVESANMPVPVVIALHEYTDTATGFQAAHGLNSHANQHGYMVVYPQASYFNVSTANGKPSLISSWNDLAINQLSTAEGPHCAAQHYNYPCPPECGECSRCGWTSCYDDVGFIERLLDTLQIEFDADPRRIYLLGVGNGGMMALRLGCNLSDRFAGVASIAAQLAPGYACGPSTNLPMLHLYGGRDNIVRQDGKPASDGYIYTSAAKTAQRWAESLHCNIGPASWHSSDSQSAGFLCSAYSDCAVAGQEIVSCVDPEQGHQWPGQRADDVLASCVTEEQFASFPEQLQCPPVGNDFTHQGMDLVWNFMRGYRSDYVKHEDPKNQ